MVFVCVCYIFTKSYTTWISLVHVISAKLAEVMKLNGKMKTMKCEKRSLFYRKCAIGFLRENFKEGETEVILSENAKNLRKLQFYQLYLLNGFRSILKMFYVLEMHSNSITISVLRWLFSLFWFRQFKNKMLPCMFVQNERTNEYKKTIVRIVVRLYTWCVCITFVQLAIVWKCMWVLNMGIGMWMLLANFSLRLHYYFVNYAVEAHTQCTFYRCW